MFYSFEYAFLHQLNAAFFLSPISSTVTLFFLSFLFLFCYYCFLRLQKEQSFFNVLPNHTYDVGVRYDIPCSCVKTDKDKNPVPVKILPTHYYNILNEEGRVVVPSNGTFLRAKRNVELSDDLTDKDFELFQRFDSGVHNRVKRTSPAITRFSKENATHYCRKLIADTDIGKRCAKVGSDVQALLDSCSMDLEVKRFPFCFFGCSCCCAFL